jgi:hypothetical protein
MKPQFRTLLLWQFMWVLIIAVACNTLNVQMSTPVASIPAIDFLLEANMLPAGWEASPCDTSLCRDGGGGDTAAERDFYLPNAPGHALQEVYRFSDERAASDKFKVYMEGNFNESEVRQPFVPFAPPQEITFKSQVADEYYFACGVDVIPQCKMLARYQNYFVYFYFDHATEQEPGGLTYAEIERVLEALEGKVAALLTASSASATDTAVQP